MSLPKGKKDLKHGKAVEQGVDNMPAEETTMLADGVYGTL